MNDHQLHQVVCATLSQIAPEADIDALEGDVDLHDQLDIDSMDFLNFVIGVNEATGIDIPERDYPQLATLDGCVKYLSARAVTR